MDLDEKNFKKKANNKSKKNNKRELLYDIEYYEYEKKMNSTDNLNNYKNYQYLSVNEKDKLENKFSKPRNISQHRLLNSLKKNDYKIVIATGPAGTGKTLFGVEQGIKNFIQGNYEKLIFTRPSVTTDEDIGFLPGTLEDKMAPWMRPIYDILYNYINPKEVDSMIQEKIIEISPLGFMRGRTFKNCWIIADEMQNSTVSQMKMLLTRIGENTKLIVTGDCEQHDRKYEINGLEDFLNKIKGRRSNSISSIEFNKNDIEREEVVKEVLDIYETNKIPYEKECSEKECSDSDKSIEIEKSIDSDKSLDSDKLSDSKLEVSDNTLEENKSKNNILDYNE
jgi:phosphate starvation-inducible PhoH-like protein